MPDSLSKKGRTRRVEEHFSAQAGRYQEASTSGLWDWWRRRERRAVFQMLQPRPGERILDAGCGAGYYAEYLLQAGARVVASDLSKEMAHRAQRHLQSPVIACDLERIALRARSFDAVLCAGALEFCTRPARAFLSLAKLLRTPKSRLVIMVPAASMAGRLYRGFHRRHGLRIHLFSARRLEALAGIAGVEMDSRARAGFNHVARFRRID